MTMPPSSAPAPRPRAARRSGPGLGVALIAIVIGSAIGVGFGFAKRPPKKSAPNDAGVTTTEDASSDEREDAGRAYVAAHDASWIDELDARDPPPESQLDPEYLISLVDMNHPDPGTFALARTIIAGRRGHANQGNYKIAHHKFTRRQCLEGLRDVVLQTPEQRAICGGPFEVPIHHGDPSSATSCIDIFEYPNHPCVLPFVNLYGMKDEELCAMAGKRLCTDQEWDEACESDPSGGAPWQYAYGNELDLTVCNTGGNNGHCRINEDLWNTCETNTEPNGSYPKCRSRLGVFDLHGNVAEAMHRWENGVDYIQLKGSAFFYDGKMYKDHCRFDPRWHVDEFNKSWHDNYHLGFRCCRSVKSLKQRALEGDAGAIAALAADTGAPTEYDEELAKDATTVAPVPSTSSSSVEDDPYATP